MTTTKRTMHEAYRNLQANADQARPEAIALGLIQRRLSDTEHQLTHGQLVKLLNCQAKFLQARYLGNLARALEPLEGIRAVLTDDLAADLAGLRNEVNAWIRDLMAIAHDPMAGDVCSLPAQQGQEFPGNHDELLNYLQVNPWLVMCGDQEHKLAGSLFQVAKFSASPDHGQLNGLRCYVAGKLPHDGQVYIPIVQPLFQPEGFETTLDGQRVFLRYQPEAEPLAAEASCDVGRDQVLIDDETA